LRIRVSNENCFRSRNLFYIESVWTILRETWYWSYVDFSSSSTSQRTSGKVKLVPATLVPAIRSNLIENEGKSWNKSICKIQSDLNEMKNASTGKSPFELVYGYDDKSMYRNPVELQAGAKERILSEQTKMKSRYDANRTLNIDFDVGNIVYMKTVPNATGESIKL